MCEYRLKASLQRNVFSEAVNIWHQMVKGARKKRGVVGKRMEGGAFV
jgi:hypothetical protein